MSSVKKGDTVRVSFTGMLGDGTVFDSAPAESPIELCIGEYRSLPVFEDAIVGMDKGETKTISVSYEDAYGEYRPEMIAIVSSKKIPPAIKVELGKMLQVQTPYGKVENVVVTDASRNKVTLDANHPLAGKDLLFEITVESIEASPGD